MKLQKILVAIKPWERGLPLAAAYARLLAEAPDARFELVSSVFDAAIAAGCERGEAAARRAQERVVAAARAGLERLAGSLRAGGAPVTTRIVWGTPPYEAILAAVQDWGADLLVVGAHELATLHARLTDTDWQLLHLARCPLLLLKSPSFGGYRTVLAAVDTSHADDESRGLDHAVLAAGRRFARAFGATLSAVGDIDSIEELGPRAILGAAAERHAELVVVGATRRRGTAAYGDAAELVVGEVPCDVLIVPLPERAPAAPRSQVR